MWGLRITLIFLIFSFFISPNGFSQTVISGKIFNQVNQTPIRGINITIQESPDSEIIGFAVSKEDGNFSISFESEKDSIYLVARSMLIKKIEFFNPNVTSFVELGAFPDEFQLEEQVVEGLKSPISSKKDTLSYEVENFTNPENRVLADVMRNLPGIEVAPNGGISYRGESIQKFYIEGLDLLEGRYNLATRNMPIDAVKSVEILENHQPIRMLDSVEFSSKTSINIRLKKKNVLIGSGYVGGGIPRIWDVKLAPMIFNDSFQSIVSVGSNNAGNTLASEILDFGNTYSQTNQISSKGWFQANGVSQNGTLNNRFAFNKSFLASVNTIKKLPNNFELKTSLDYSKEHINNTFLTNNFYFLSEDTVRVFESGIISEDSDLIRLTFNLTRNASSDYFHNRFQASLANTSLRSDYLFLGRNINQESRQPDFHLFNNFRKLIKVGARIMDLNSEMSYSLQKPRLTTMPPFLGIEMDFGPTAGKSIQKIRYSNYAFNNFISYKNLRILNFRATGTSGLLIKNSILTSASFLENLPLGLPFQNDQSLKEISGTSSISLERNLKKSTMKLSLPLRYTNFKLTDFSNKGSVGNPNQLFFEPEIYWTLNFEPYFNFRNSFSRNISVGDLYDLYPGKIFINYQTTQIKNSHIPIVRENRLVFGQSFKDPLIALFINSTFSFSYSTRNTIAQNQIQENGSALLNIITRDNSGKSFLWKGDISKFISSIRTTLSASSTINWAEREIIVNDVLQTINFNRINGVFKAAYRPTGKLNFELKYEYTSVQSFSENSFNSQSLNYIPSLTFILLPVKNHIAKLTFESMTIDSNAGRSKAQINFLDFDYSYKIPKKRIELTLFGSNILGENFLTTISNSSFVFIEDLRTLRPRQVTFRIGYSL